MGSAETRSTASALRVTGKRVIRTQERGWDIPYCNRCLDHHGIRRPGPPSKSYVTALIGSVLLLACLGSCTFLVGLGGIVGARDNPSGLLCAVFLFLLTAGAAALVFLLLLPGIHKSDLRKENLFRDQLDDYHAETDACKRRGCACLHRAVEYRGWAGSVHTFEFWNRDFADAFVQSNRGKVLG